MAVPQADVAPLEILRDGWVLLPQTSTCNICAYDGNRLKANGCGQHIPCMWWHITSSTDHKRRVNAGRIPPHPLPPSVVNAPQYQAVVRCIPCTLDPQGWPRLSAGGSMQPASVAAHIATPDHIRRSTAPDHRLLDYHTRHAYHAGRLPNELW